MCSIVGLDTTKLAEETLADLLRPAARGGQNIIPHLDPRCLRRIIREHWSKVAALAHRIHEEPDEPQVIVYASDSTTITIVGTHDRAYLKRVLEDAGYKRT